MLSNGQESEVSSDTSWILPLLERLDLALYLWVLSSIPLAIGGSGAGVTPIFSKLMTVTGNPRWTLLMCVRQLVR